MTKKIIILSIVAIMALSSCVRRRNPIQNPAQGPTATEIHNEVDHVFPTLHPLETGDY